MTAALWMVLVASALLLTVVLAVEETRVAEAHREAASWQKRTCHHGSTSFQPYEGDEGER